MSIEQSVLFKVICAVGLFFVMQLMFFWSNDVVLCCRVRDRLPLADSRRDLPMIYFVTPTRYRPAQKADLTRLGQTLAHVPNLYWIVVEDAEVKSAALTQLIERTHIPSAHLHALTPSNMRINDSDPNWKLPRGVLQRNAALNWVNFGNLKRGVVYFGDDDNVYDWRLFNEMRHVKKVGVWPVGIVGGLIVETPILDGSVCVF
uniref:Galactosylgalactosylxylosylprotein 3-beta-glucuronosyltransferase n=1 Tax=Parascaris equorum TaxID=6256 RepID=A0A914RLL3_PAREQ